MLEDRLEEALKRVLQKDEIQDLIGREIEKIIEREHEGPLAQYIKQHTAKA